MHSGFRWKSDSSVVVLCCASICLLDDPLTDQRRPAVVISSGPVVPGAVVREIAPYNLVKKTTALVEACQQSKQDFCVMDDEIYPK